MRRLRDAMSRERHQVIPYQPFGLSLSKPFPFPARSSNERKEGFDKLSPNGNIGL